MYQTIAQIIGIVAMAAVIYSFQCKRIKFLYIFQLIGSFLFTIHFFMLGAYIGSLMNLVGLVRSGLFAMGERTHKKPVLYMILLSIVLFTIIGWQQETWKSLLPFAAQMLGTLVLWTGDNTKVRVCQLSILSPCWIIYNILNASIGGIICEIFNSLSVIVYFARIKRSKIKVDEIVKGKSL